LHTSILCCERLAFLPHLACAKFLRQLLFPNAHAYRLYVFNEPYLPSNDLDSHRFAISEALYYNTKKFQINKILKFFHPACQTGFRGNFAF
ncbi:hypothetical protein, partial [Vandammella animalimorsus]|uniref:hypothetical protein n=1 Tax=Vandammella animalimorsus TaxID=2029117 RepID=UPI001EEF4D87